MNVLILCTGNSARSVLGEALITELSGGRLTGFSAGSQPKGAPHPLALETLGAHGHRAAGYSSKSWDVFATSDAPRMRLIITVCDSAAAEVCPVWPQDPARGGPVTAHWGIPDPAAVEGSDDEKRAAFEAAYQRLHKRVTALLALPLEALADDALKAEVNAIGRMAD